MPDALFVYALQCVEHLCEIAHHLFVVQGCLQAFELSAQVLPVDVVHDIIGGAVLLEKVMHPDDMFVVQFSESACFFLELLQLLIEERKVVDIAHADGGIVVIALRHPLYEKLLDGHCLVELDIGSHISIAESTRREVALYAVDAPQDSPYGQHGTLVDAVLVHDTILLSA